MTIRYTNFTPEVMLSAPRRSTAIPNPSGTKLLYSISTYSFHSHRRTAEIRVFDIESRKDTCLCGAPGYREPLWLSDTEVLLLGSVVDGVTSLSVIDIRTPGAVTEISRASGTLDNLRVRRLSDTEVAIAVSAPTTPQGKLYTPSHAKPRYSTAKVYTQLFVRHWDTYNTENKNSVWYGLLRKSGTRYTLASPGLTNALEGTGLECPVPFTPGTNHFDLGPSGIAFVAKDPELNPAMYTKTDLYYVPLKSYTEKPPQQKPSIVHTEKLQGYSASPTFSHSGKKLIFTRMRSKQYESDKRRLMIIPDITDLTNLHEFYSSENGQGTLDLSPDELLWSHDDEHIYFTAESFGKVLLLKVPADATTTKHPIVLYNHDSVINAVVLANSGHILVSGSSLIESMAYYIVKAPSTATATEKPQVELLFSSTSNGALFGLSRKQCDDFWFKGAEDVEVHALVMRPANFNETQKYPLAFLIHGGPQGAWNDAWSTRWNPALFAQQGYVVVACNPTGSTGYGQAFTDAIANSWGGRPYRDLECCMNYIAAEMPYVDMQRAVALGASYGGYMINWIAGQPLARRFKALVCHDGIFSTHTKWATEELFFPYHDFGGAPWDPESTYRQWDPAQFHGRWETPMMVIHNELDYRLPISEGLAMFNVLQARNIPSKFLTFPDENHWVLKPENSLVWHKEVFSFINEHAKVKAPA
ncbi:Dipeptidyl-peptidase 5 [Ceratocystis fimbriata CBS 114723]|uniref:Dipeptidyl-peptidase V n=1 Tax=Ceratocystis fimbriata CBS 114723 TaxID=1035309 RepID=A0A2C5WYP9_9PEZI|nr:Dipeptidyl-peptidase 5 [Ceratocystis fimbriata CBS 114723]